jgi:hemolysin activation/secretion protein
VKARSGRLRGLACLILALALAWAGAALSQELRPAGALPGFAELEAAGARIGNIRILNQNIFDTSDPEEDEWLFRWANRLHVQSRADLIEGLLLFKTGDLLRVSHIEETERLLRGSRFLYDVELRPVAWHDGVVDIEVATRDTWTLDPGLSLNRSGGANSFGFKLREYNLLGSGVAVSLGYSSDVDRSGSEFQISRDNAFDSRVSLSYSHADNSDGRRQAVSVSRPFYALDTRWAAGISASTDDRLEPVYNAGNVVAEYRRRQERAEVLGGWSSGRVNGWVQRWSLGLSLDDNAYALEPGKVAPAYLPADERLVAPFLRYQLIEDRFEKLRNRNQIGRPEFFALGLASTLQLGHASSGLGSTRNAWLYSGSISRGFVPAPEQTLLASASLSGELSGNQWRRQQFGGAMSYFLPQGKRWLFYAAASGDVLSNPDPSDELLLGGDNGLRGYPLRYQSGLRRALFTVEERTYTDLFLYRLVRVGGAAFVDVGRAWGGNNINTSNPGWLSDVGLGLRFFSVRAAFSNVVHVDLAVPLNRTADISSVQFLVKSKSSF